jgi:hypothetical protein
MRGVGGIKWILRLLWSIVTTVFFVGLAYLPWIVNVIFMSLVIVCSWFMIAMRRQEIDKDSDAAVKIGKKGDV